MNLSIADLELIPGARVVGNRAHHGRARFTGVSTDSRSVAKGNVFIALRGETFDGHTFIADAIRSGVSAVVVDADYEIPAGVRRSDCTIVIVPETTKALGDLALLYRLKFDIPVIAVGGSNGKTTTKEMIAAVLREKFSVLSTEGNLNNHIGVPQMLLRLRPDVEAMVLEVGTNHFGELQYLCSMALPTHAVVTNIGREHLEFFGTLEGVADEETELFRYMERSEGRAFVNADDRYLKKAAAVLPAAVTYGRSAGVDIRAEHIELDENACASFDCALGAKKTVRRFRLGAAGAHNVSNALAAIAVGSSFGISASAISRALAKFISASKRMEIIRRQTTGVTILNDTYNANPDSVDAALQTLASMNVRGKKIVVLGDMFELGARAAEEHQSVGRAVRKAKPSLLVTVGALSRAIHEAARLKGAIHCETKDEAIDVLKRLIGPGDAVLVKGSRGMKMELIVAQL